MESAVRQCVHRSGNTAEDWHALSSARCCTDTLCCFLPRFFDGCIVGALWLDIFLGGLSQRIGAAPQPREICSLDVATMTRPALNQPLALLLFDAPGTMLMRVIQQYRYVTRKRTFSCLILALSPLKAGSCSKESWERSRLSIAALVAIVTSPRQSRTPATPTIVQGAMRRLSFHLKRQIKLKKSSETVRPKSSRSKENERKQKNTRDVADNRISNPN